MRITKKDKELYNELVKKTKRKVKNTVKKYGATIYDVKQDIINKQKVQEVVSYDIREKLNVPSLESFKSRKEFNEFIENQTKFVSNKSPHFKFSKNEKGIVMSDFLKLVFENKHHKAEKIRKKEEKKLAGKPVFHNEEQIRTIGQTMEMMSKPSAPEFKKIPLNFNSFWNKGDFERKLLNLKIKGSQEDYQEKRETMKQNFIEAIEQHMNSDGDVIVEKLRNMSEDDFYEMYWMFHESFDFDHFYPKKVSDGKLEEMDIILGNMERDFEMYERQKESNWLKPF